MEAAIVVQNARKKYGSGSKTKLILNSLNMMVAKGQIYGLLGSSGCGKTTLLSSIVGIKDLNDGNIFLLGHKVKRGSSYIFEKQIGYMPQEMGLVEQFEIQEVIRYFGYIYGIENEVINKRFEFLKNLLDLPPEKRFVKNCSGGQKRRISFAATLIHDPDVLILDEPTVGLDPILRDDIWNYLAEISTNFGKTVIITTHYIDETKQADTIGLMRNGQIIAEESPRVLLNMFHCETLEDVFLILSQKQTRGEDVKEFNTPEYLNKRKKVLDIINNAENEIPKLEYVHTTNKFKSNLNLSRLKALSFKNFKQFSRSYNQFGFMILFPLSMLLSFFFSVGYNKPMDITLGIINNEVENWSLQCSNYELQLNTVSFFGLCAVQHLSCGFIQTLNDTKTKKKFYENFAEAKEDYHKFKINGIIEFPKNFTEMFSSRMLKKQSILDFNWLPNVNMSEINIYINDNDFQIFQDVKFELLTKYEEFLKKLTSVCQINLHFFESTMKFMDPIYGKKDQTYSSNSLPGYLVVIIFLSSSVCASTIIVHERSEGIWDRNLVAGVKNFEIIVSHIISQFIFNLVLVFMCLLSITVIFDVEINGSIWEVVTIFLITQLLGLLQGLLLSTLTKNEYTVIYMTTGSFFPITLVSGILWPVEGMPKILYDTIKYLPFFQLNKAFQYIMLRGWDYTYPEIANTYAILLLWILIGIILIIISTKFKL